MKQTVPFDESAFQPYLGSGTANIVGSAFLKTQGGDVKVGAGDRVELIPSTPYTAERFGIATSGMRIEARDGRLQRYIRTTLADAQGNFEFRNIPAGSYFLACTITWQYASQFGALTSGGQAIAPVTVRDSETEKVVLTK